MPDDLTKRGPQDRARVSKQEHEHGINVASAPEAAAVQNLRRRVEKRLNVIAPLLR